MIEPAGDLTLLRRAFGAYPTGVTVVTTRTESGEPVGFTANSFTSVSLEPPLLLVCPAHGAASYPAFARAESFAVNLMTAEQETLARRFATRGADKFDGTAWRPGSAGAPLIEGSLAWFDCRIHARVAAGDHDVLIGRIVGLALHPGQPLVYHAGRFGLAAA